MALLLFSSIICATIAVITSCNCGPKLPQDPFDPLGDWHQRVSESSGIVLDISNYEFQNEVKKLDFYLE